jgi:hypothetical protein
MTAAEIELMVQRLPHAADLPLPAYATTRGAGGFGSSGLAAVKRSG